MHLLLTNDDGIDAPGLAALAEAARGFGRVTIVAPDQHLSGCGHQTTTSRPLRAQRVGEGRFALNGTPADCVRVGLLHLATDADWVLSGINDGGNLGVDVYMSGTVAGAREGMLFGRNSMALSQYRLLDRLIDWQRSTRFAKSVIAELMSKPLSPGSFWNVNFPAQVSAENDADELPRRVYCPLDPHPLGVRLDEVDGQYHYRSNYHERKRIAQSDVATCFAGQIAITQVVHHAAELD
jgi:5'-nucleotidase